MDLIDIGANLTHDSFDHDRDAVLARAREAGVAQMVITGASREHSPLALKLAITSYLLSLAVFIPASGWTADRFGARTVFRAAIAVFVVGSIGCAISGSLTDFVIARIIQGMGGAMMTPVGRMVLVRSISKRDRCA